MEGFKRKNIEEKHQELQNQDLLGSPHLEEIWFGGIMDLDLLSLFPLEGGKNHGGKRRNQAPRIATMEERELKRLGEQWGRRPLFIWGHKCGRWGQKSTQPQQPGLGPAWLGRNQKRPALARLELGLGWPNCRKTSYTKTNIF